MTRVISAYTDIPEMTRVISGYTPMITKSLLLAVYNVKRYGRFVNVDMITKIHLLAMHHLGVSMGIE